jgi:carboxyl-terminal processing protease
LKEIICMVAIATAGSGGAPAVAGAPTAETDEAPPALSVADRMIIAAQINHVVKRYFAHWEGLTSAYDWDSRFEEYVKEAVDAKDRRTFSLATMRLIASLENGHSSFSDKLIRDEPYLPFHARPVEGRWVVTASWTSHLSPGDVISSVDGVPIEQWLGPIRAIVGQSNLRARDRVLLINGRTLWPQRVRLGLASSKTVTVDRTAPRGEGRPAGKPFDVATTVRDDGTVIIRIPSFDSLKFESAAMAAIRAHAGAPLIVFDVRGNGGGITPMLLLRTIMDRPYAGTIVTTPMTNAENDARRSLDPSAPPLQVMVRYGPELNQPAATAVSGAMAILMDGGCASACEDFVTRFRSGNRGPLLGETTFGSTGQPYVLEWPKWKMTLRISTKREFMPDGRPFEGVGITPDIAIPALPADFDNASDLQLERALAALRSSPASGLPESSSIR